MISACIALVPEYAGFDFRELARVSAALQKQITRDVSPIWGVTATVDPFDRLEDVPLGYWPIILTLRDLAGQDGMHLDAQGSPYALVQVQAQWSLSASHECIELLVDPSGNRTVAGRSPKDDARVEFLLEPCDPCQSAESAYTVNDVVVSDFVTPEYYGPVVASSGRHSYSGRITRGQQVLPGGCLSWREPMSGLWYQREALADGSIRDQEVGPARATTAGQEPRTLREALNAKTQHHRRIAQSASSQQVARLTDLAGRGRRASVARATSLRDILRSLDVPPRAGPSS
ncbi:MAG: hypothetical protein JOZ69_06675, partial [Myxococcales bacterium]|nr:hypothetical protein [Myxococcales bacterium]